MDTDAPTTRSQPSPTGSKGDPQLLTGLPVYPADTSDDEALDYSDDPILEQSYRTLGAVNDAIHDQP